MNLDNNYTYNYGTHGITRGLMQRENSSESETFNQQQITYITQGFFYHEKQHGDLDDHPVILSSQVISCKTKSTYPA